MLARFGLVSERHCRASRRLLEQRPPPYRSRKQSLREFNIESRLRINRAKHSDSRATGVTSQQRNDSTLSATAHNEIQHRVNNSLNFQKLKTCSYLHGYAAECLQEIPVFGICGSNVEFKSVHAAKSHN